MRYDLKVKSCVIDRKNMKHFSSTILISVGDRSEREAERTHEHRSNFLIPFVFISQLEEGKARRQRQASVIVTGQIRYVVAKLPSIFVLFFNLSLHLPLV